MAQLLTTIMALNYSFFQSGLQNIDRPVTKKAKNNMLCGQFIIM